MRAFITGSAGFIGHNVVRFLEQQGVECFGIDSRTNYGFIPTDELDYLIRERFEKIRATPLVGDIRNSDDISTRIGVFNCDTIIHLASFPRQKVVNANPAYAADVMMRGLINLLENAKKHKVKRFVYMSSSMVYGDFEDQVLEDSECQPQGQYGIMKLAGEWLVKDYARRTGMEYVILRPSAVYGPLDVEDRVVAKFMLTAMRGGVLKVNGAGETLDFTYVDDAADGVVSAATRVMSANKTYNITKSHSVSLLEAAEMIVKIVGKGTIECRDKDADFPSRGALNIDRARTILGFDPQVDVNEGFKKYYDWLSNSVYWQSKL